MSNRNKSSTGSPPTEGTPPLDASAPIATPGVSTGAGTGVFLDSSTRESIVSSPYNAGELPPVVDGKAIDGRSTSLGEDGRVIDPHTIPVQASPTLDNRIVTSPPGLTPVLLPVGAESPPLSYPAQLEQLTQQAQKSQQNLLNHDGTASQPEAVVPVPLTYEAQQEAFRADAQREQDANDMRRLQYEAGAVGLTVSQLERVRATGVVASPRIEDKYEARIRAERDAAQVAPKKPSVIERVETRIKDAMHRH
jgi:hypothetical protein